eukprot:CAMPEP_0174283326 /NCGR_PEP_ID=MMETSP0809-20121228/4003_1 /TAXON_ID=73025 ORGANISM="Eutreptiella gymnastica-like, Strain CCMP1594" /NCGR_SAMPLE_ID=MMETSP0809 /ASSEMBLY_ACC=CAM_ASM_000658 /LENGTH=552 /DNA_ID=CAMNT_0015378183 /DNA_START=121 /DNA_END=1779 /DNA_ORIENTATION=-
MTGFHGSPSEYLKRRPGVQSIIWSGALTFKFALYSLVAVIPLFIILYLPQSLPWEQGWLVNVVDQEPVIIPKLTFFQDETTRLLANLVVFLYMPLCYCIYAGLSWWRFLTVMLIPLALAVVYRWLVYTVISLWMIYAIFIPFGIWILPLLVVTPRQARLLIPAALNWACSCIGVVAFFFLWSLNPQQAAGRIFVVVVLFPVLKEVIVAIGRIVCKRLLLGAGAYPMKSAWETPIFLFMVSFQMASTFNMRLFVARIPVSFLPVLMLFNSVQEIVLRTSVYWRDRFIAFVKKLLLCKYCRRSVHPAPQTVASIHEVYMQAIPLRRSRSLPHLQPETPVVRRCNSLPAALSEDRADGTRAGDTPGPQTGLRAWMRDIMFLDSYKSPVYSQFLMGDAISEYAAIIFVHLFPLLFSSRLLQVPLDYFNDPDLDWGNPLQGANVLYSFLIQILSEVVVDTVCIAIANYFNHDLCAAWKFFSKKALIIGLIAAGTFSCAVSTNTMRVDYVRPCFGVDMCYCSKGYGLSPGGLRERYCLHIYQNSSIPGRPPRPPQAAP